MPDADLVRRLREPDLTLVRLREAYDVEEVDRFLEELARELSAGRPVAAMVDRVRFTPVRMRHGYEMGEVDALLDEAVAASSGASAGLTASPAVLMIQQARFRARIRGPRYAMATVDDLLSRARDAALAGRIVAEAAGDVRELRLVRLGQGYDADEVDALLIRLGLTPTSR